METKATSFGGSLPVPCVQEWANRSLTSVPPRYVHHDQDPPIISLNSSSPQVPLINHEVSSCFVEKFKSEIGDFFKLPIEEKNKYKQQEGDVEGYGNAFVVSEE
ncbi:hypothetical protein QYF36_004238 [Acer negundo]|nr:hypothetical protein QYF36_004238 [Acer negundo]